MQSSARITSTTSVMPQDSEHIFMGTGKVYYIRPCMENSFIVIKGQWGSEQNRTDAILFGIVQKTELLSLTYL